MYFTGLGTALPNTAYTQAECWEALQQAPQFPRLTPRSRAILRKVLTGSNGIRTRHLALDTLVDAFDLHPDTLHRRFARHAPALAIAAAQRALADADIAPGQIDAVLVSTCTGYLCPGLTSYVAQGLGLRPDVLGLDLVGQGCAAALPNFRTSQALLQSGAADRVLSVCVEICTAAMYLDDDPGVLISACLFGDGAGAAILARDPGRHPRLEWLGSHSFLDPAQRDALRFEQSQGLLRNRLSPAVPDLAARAVEHVLAQTLTEADFSRDGISGWLLHPGGRDVLAAIARQLHLTPEHIRWSASVLERCGNLSSASLYFVLQEALRETQAPGYWWLSSFGAGFTCHGALLQFHRSASKISRSADSPAHLQNALPTH